MELLNAGHEAIIVDDLSNAKADVVNRIGEICGRNPSFYPIDCADATALSCLKCECIYPMPKLMAKNMAAEIDRYIVFCNHYRIHMRYRNTPMNIRRRGLARQNRFNFDGHGSKRHKAA